MYSTALLALEKAALWRIVGNLPRWAAQWKALKDNIKWEWKVILCSVYVNSSYCTGNYHMKRDKIWMRELRMLQRMNLSEKEPHGNVYFFLTELPDVLAELLQLFVRGDAASGNVIGCSTQRHTQLLILLRQLTQLFQTLTLFLLQGLQVTAQVLLYLKNRQVFLHLEKFKIQRIPLQRQPHQHFVILLWKSQGKCLIKWMYLHEFVRSTVLLNEAWNQGCQNQNYAWATTFFRVFGGS